MRWSIRASGSNDDRRTCCAQLRGSCRSRVGRARAQSGFGARRSCSLPALAVLAVLAPWIVPYDPDATDLDHVLQGPGRLHWFGTDQVGRDVFSRVLVAARLDLAIAVSAVRCPSRSERS